MQEQTKLVKVSARESGVVELETTQKIKTSTKKRIGRKTFLTLSAPVFMFFLLIGTPIVLNAQLFGPPNFKCNKDKLHGAAVRFSQDPKRLILGQTCEVTIYNRNQEKVSNKGFSLTSENRDSRV